MSFSRKLERQLRFTLAIAEVKSALIVFLNKYNEILKREPEKREHPFVAADNLLEAVFRQHMSDNSRDWAEANKLTQDILNFPSTLLLPEFGMTRHKRLEELASEDFDGETRAWLKEVIDQLSDIPLRIRKEVRGTYVRAYAQKLADDFERRLQEVRKALQL